MFGLLKCVTLLHIVRNLLCRMPEEERRSRENLQRDQQLGLLLQDQEQKIVINFQYSVYVSREENFKSDQTLYV